MPRYRFHTVVTGHVTAPGPDEAATAVEEFIQVGNGLPDELTYLDTQIHEVMQSRVLQEIGKREVQLELFTMPRISS